MRVVSDYMNQLIGNFKEATQCNSQFSSGGNEVQVNGPHEVNSG